MTLQEFIVKHELTSTSQRIDRRGRSTADNWGRDARHWVVRISSASGGGMGVEFSQGSAWKTEPTLTDVLECLSLDFASIYNASDFEEWAGDLGYDTDSRKAEAIYNECTRQGETFKAAFGAEAYFDLIGAEGNESEES